MWHTKHVSKDNPDFAASILELLQSTSRNLIFVTSGIYLIWHFAVTLIWSDIFMKNIWSTTSVVLLTCAISLWLLEKHFVLAQAVWQIGVAVAITIAYFTYQWPEITFLYALLPLIAVVTLGKSGGLLAEGSIIALVWSFSLSQTMPLPPDYGMAIVVGGAFTGLLGWAASHTLLTVTHWSLFNFNQAQINLEDANQHRGEVVRVMKALDHAYSQLERVNNLLVLTRAEAEEAQEARNRFAMAVSHELRTPLNFILGFSEMMVNSPSTYAVPDSWPPGLYEDVQEIYRSSTHLSRLVNDVLDLGQIEARQMTLFKETVNLSQLTKEVEDMVAPVLKRKGLQFNTEIESGLPDIFIDRTRIRQVLLNLVSNSLRFTEQGGVTIRLQREEEAILVSVEDTGAGIAPDDLPKLFEEFRQVGEGSWRRREGSGLGIPISRQFVQLHGGRMWVESEGIPGRGTQFYFTLPIPSAAANLLDTSSEEVSSGETANTRQWQFLKDKATQEQLLLVLSPDPVAGELISQYAEDYEVVAICEPDQAHPKIVQFLPNALIVDQAILKEKAVQAVLQNLPYSMPVVSFIFPGNLNQLKQLPDEVSDYLVKPISRQRLAETVQALGPNVRNLLVVDDDPAMVRFVTLALEDEGLKNEGLKNEGLKNEGLKDEGLTSEGLRNEGNGQHQGNGYRFATALTGTEALEQLHRQRPDAVLLDLGLPDINGWEVLAQLRQEPELAELPVVIITANDFPQMLQTDQQEALQVLLNRPFSRQELSTILKSLLEALQPSYPILSAPIGPGHPVTLFG